MCEFLEYLSEHPSAAEILAAVYKVEVKSRKPFRAMSENEVVSGINEAQRIFGPGDALPVEQAPADFRDNVQWATELMEKMKIGKA